MFDAISEKKMGHHFKVQKSEATWLRFCLAEKSVLTHSLWLKPLFALRPLPHQFPLQISQRWCSPR
ncbi:hypothetical protein E5T98_23605, partial [Vibrio vulnificus]|nr:hypothetical protein [Vibrio vulnificus]